MSENLFPLPDAADRGAEADRTPNAPRVQRPERRQVELRAVDLEGLLPADHRARGVWEFVTGLDLAPLYAGIKAVEGHAGSG